MRPVCGECKNYKHGDDPECKRGVKSWGYLKTLPCFETDQEGFVKVVELKKGHSLVEGVEFKVCKICGESKPLKKYTKAKTTYDGYQPMCNHCLYVTYHKK